VRGGGSQRANRGPIRSHGHSDAGCDGEGSRPMVSLVQDKVRASAALLANVPNRIILTRSPPLCIVIARQLLQQLPHCPFCDRRQDSRRRLPRCSPPNVDGHGVRFAKDCLTVPRRRVSSTKHSAGSPHCRPAVVRSWFLHRTDNRILARLVVSHHVRTQEPACAVISRRDGPVWNRRRSH
jgi:hypothetical protein